MERARILFMSSSSFGLAPLRDIIKSNHNILAVYSNSLKKSGRGLKYNKSVIHSLAEEHDIQIRTSSNLNTKDEIKFIEDLNIDLGIVVSYGKIIPEIFLSKSKYGFLNIHPSLLPRWRGAAPIQRALMNGDKSTGVNIIRLDPGIDTGDICLTSEVAINKDDNYGRLSLTLSEIGAKLIIEAINKTMSGEINFIKQSNANIFYADKIHKNETKISFNQNAIEVNNLIRGLSPSPGAWFSTLIKNNETRVKILDAQIVDVDGLPGQILDEKLLIACKKNAIRPITLQKEGKKQMNLDDFLRGNEIRKGTKIT